MTARNGEIMEVQQEKLQHELRLLGDLCARQQQLAEQHRATIADRLHDEMGGLLIAARLNVAWLEERLPTDDPLVQLHFTRLQDALLTGVDVKRRIVEDLRPTLLDHIGLYSALKWHMSEACAQLDYTEHYPDEELQLRPDAAIIVFRIVEEGLLHVITVARPQRVQLAVQEAADTLRLRLRAVSKHDDASSGETKPPTVDDALDLEMIRQRVVRLGGDYQWRDSEDAADTDVNGATSCELNISLPLANLLLKESRAALPVQT
ncbi:MAG: sensor histidine kinase [Steroidobacteraceae bacterium]